MLSRRRLLLLAGEAAGSLALSGCALSPPLKKEVFADFGDVEDSFKFGTVRASAGFGVRLTLPFFSQFPLALDFGIPIRKNAQDDTRIFSFSLGTVQ